MAIVLNALAVDGTTGEIIGLPDNGRDSARYAWSDEDLAYSVPAYAAAVNGGRPVQNLVTLSEDLTGDKWAHTAAIDSAVLVTFGASGQYISEDIATTEGHTYILSFWARNVTGNTTMQARHNNSATGNTTAITIDGTLERYSFIVLGRTGGGDVSFGLQDDSGSGWGQAEFTKIQVEDVTGRADMTVPSEYTDRGVGDGDELGTNGTFDTDLTGWSEYGNTHTWQSPGVLQSVAPTPTIGSYHTFSTVANTQYVVKVECVAGSTTYLVRAGNGTFPNAGIYSTPTLTGVDSVSFQFTAIGSNSYIYLRHIATGTLQFDNISVQKASTQSGYAVYGTENGNSVTSNVVTEGVGAALSPVPRLSHCPAATNSFQYSNDLTNATYTTYQASPTFDQVGLTGHPDTASRFIDNSATGTGTVYVRQSLVTVVSGEDNVVTLRAKKDQINYIVIQTTNFDVAANKITYYNLDAGTIVSSTHDASEIVDDGSGFYVCRAQFNTVTDTTGNVYFYLSQNGTNLTVDLDGTSSIIWGNVELHKGKDLAHSRGIPPIFTTTITISTTADDYSYAIANHSDTELTYACEWTPGYSASEATGDQEIITLGTAPDMLYHDATNGDIESTDGTNTSTKAETITAGTTYDLEVAYSTGADSLQVSVDGTGGSDVAYDDAFPTGTKISLFRNSSFAQEMFAFTITEPDTTSIPVFAHHYMHNIG